ncbi:MAG: hypothetical protein NUW01_11435 [Gemmatimonadaceae bacterium]|nr:hypothetical protein [Gemmatimonadaceae bacterium]
MGADGTLYLMRTETFRERYPDLDERDCGLYERTLLGVDAVCAYSDTEGRDDFEGAKTGLAEQEAQLLRDQQYVQEKETHTFNLGSSWYRTIYRAEVEQKLAEVRTDSDALAYHKRVLEAVNWFQEHASKITVWT